MLAGYFLQGLRKELKSAVASIDIAAGFDTLVNAAARVEKRLGMTTSRSRARSSSDSDGDSDSDEGLDTKSSSKLNVPSGSDLDDDDDRSAKRSSKKKKTSSKKKQKEKRSKKEEELVDKL